MISDWKIEQKKIITHIRSFEKDLLKVFSFNKTTTNKNEILQLCNVEEKRAFDRETENEQLFKNIFHLKKEIYNFKEQIKMFEKTPEYLQKIQDISERLQFKIQNLKEKYMKMFDQLATQEQDLEKQLNIVEENLEKYEIKSQNFNSTTSSQASTMHWQQKQFLKFQKIIFISKKQKQIKDDEDENLYDIQEEESKYSDISDKENNDCQNEQLRAKKEEKYLKEFKQEIENIDKEIIKIGGPNCGWLKEDHNQFLKLRTKYKNNITKLAFVNDCICYIPTLDQNEIREHIEAFQRYEELEDIKKNLLSKYKQLKEQQKQTMILALQEQEQIKKQCKKKQTKTQEELIEEREEKKKQIKEWKIRKEASKLVVQENYQEYEKQSKEERRKKEEQLKAKAIKQLNDYKEAKQQEKQKKLEKTQQEQQLKKAIIDPLEQQRIREKELRMLEIQLANKAKKKQHQQEQLIKEQRMKEKTYIQFAYVQSKVMEPQKGPKRDILHIEKKDAGTFGGNILGAGRRAVPTWRQGLL